MTTAEYVTLGVMIALLVVSVWFILWKRKD
jgi:hypothetical protein